MKYSSIFALILITLIVSACGAREVPAVPTANPVDFQNTIAAAAFTVVAETQAAIPTATPIPPTATFTDTPVPTDTLPPLPSSQATLTPAPGGTSGGADPCVDKPLPSTLQGEPVRIRITNSTDAALAVSVYLNSSASQSQCGYRTYTLDSGEFIVLNNLVEGCYTLWAWNPIPEDYFIVTNGTSCIDDSDSWVFDISTRDIKLRT
jgi:hypothetical protein